MLDQLARYATSEGLDTEPGFAPKNVLWSIPIAADGTPIGELIRLGSEQDKRRGHRFMRAPNLSLGEMKRGGTGTRHFLADALGVIIRLGGEDDPKVAAKNAFFLGLLEQAEAVVPELAAAARHLRDGDTQEALRAAALEQKAKPTDNATFAVRRGGRWVFPLDDERWHDWWRAFRSTLKRPAKKRRGKAVTPARMRCLMTGELMVPERTQPKIKGLASVGGHSAGDVLAAFKQDSFRSYGLEQAQNAAVSPQAAARYTVALERLIRRGKRLQHAVIAHWYERPSDAQPDADLPPELIEMIQGLDDENQQRDKMAQAKRLLDDWQTPGDVSIEMLHRTSFHAYTLSGAAGRVMVRDVIDGPFHALLESHQAWFDELAIVRRDDDTRLAPPPKFYALLAATVRELKDIPAPLEAALWRAALRHETPIPRDALARTLARTRIDVIAADSPRHARYGLLKAALNRSIRLATTQGDIHPVSQALDENHPDPAYHCGRVMAVLASLQFRALGDVGAGVIQRYYAAASASPAMVLGRLLRNAQFHLNKLDPGRKVWFEKKIAAILANIEQQFPTNLDLEHQSLFALGYYQQQAHDRTKKTAPATSNPKAATPSTPEQESAS